MFIVLAADGDARVRMPMELRIESYRHVFCKEPCLHDVYAVADGLKLCLEQSGDCVIQNTFIAEGSTTIIL